MLKKFEKREGKKTKAYLQIIADEYFEAFKAIPAVAARWCDASNESAWIFVNGAEVSNITYAFGADTIRTLRDGIDTFLLDLESEMIHKNYRISFRAPFEISQDYDNGKYRFLTRLALIPKKLIK